MPEVVCWRSFCNCSKICWGVLTVSVEVSAGAAASAGVVLAVDGAEVFADREEPALRWRTGSWG